jgi:hypothetical protein
MSSLHPASRGLNQMSNGTNGGRSSTSNLNGSDMKLEVNSHSGLLGQPSPSATILDTLKKKMNQLKDELEVTRDEAERSRHQLDEEKRRREVVSLSRY